MNYDGGRIYSVHTREEIREKMMKEVVQISEVFSLSLSDATEILVHLCWNLGKASERLVDDKETFLSELGLVGSNSPSTDIEVDGEGDDKEMHERYVLASFVESNKDSIKWCPEYYCNYAIERHDEDHPSSEDFGVVCLCGHRFCWSCLLEPHRPVTCHNASIWLNELTEESRMLPGITERIQHCRKCGSLVENQDGVRKCILCKASSPSNESALIIHLALWNAGHEAIRTSKRDLEVIKQASTRLTAGFGLGELDMKALSEAWMLIVQCRLVLKWSCVFGYFITDYHSAKKNYLTYLREIATANLVTHKETLHKVTSEVISGGDITAFRKIVEDTTTTTDKHFQRFVKTLEDGLCHVKVDTDVSGTTDYWFCDRCKYKNDSSVQECRICAVSFESPPNVALGNSNTSASAHRQGGTNPLEFEDEWL